MIGPSIFYITYKKNVFPWQWEEAGVRPKHLPGPDLQLIGPRQACYVE